MSIKQVVRDFYEKSGCALHYEKAAEKLGIDAKVVCTAIWSLKQDGSLTPTTRRGVYKINTGQLPPIIKMEAQPKSEPQVEALPVEPVQEPQPQSQPELEPKGPIYLVAMLSFEDHEFRTIERNGERLWVLADVCDANDIGNPSKVACLPGGAAVDPQDRQLHRTRSRPCCSDDRHGCRCPGYNQGA